MRLLEDIITENNDYLPAGTKVHVIDEGILDWLSAIGTGIKHAGKFVIKLISTLSNSGISQSDIEAMAHSEIPPEHRRSIKTEVKAYKDKYDMRDKATRNVIINLIKMKHTNPDMRKRAEKALKEITGKLKLREKPDEETAA